MHLAPVGSDEQKNETLMPPRMMTKNPVKIAHELGDKGRVKLVNFGDHFLSSRDSLHRVAMPD
jgi:hypothetical protein